MYRSNATQRTGKTPFFVEEKHCFLPRRHEEGTKVTKIFEPYKTYKVI